MASLPLERSPDAELVDPLRAGKLAGAGLDVFGAVRRQPRPIPLGLPARQPVRARAGLLTGGGAAPRVSDALPTVHPLEAETAAPSDAGPRLRRRWRSHSDPRRSRNRGDTDSLASS